jgi:predicted transcriptional regulator
MSTLEFLPDLVHLGATIRERRMELGWTQNDLAEQSEVPQADISRIERGQLDARWSTMHRIFHTLSSATSKRSLANGGRVSTMPSPATAWKPKGRVLPRTK